MDWADTIEVMVMIESATETIVGHESPLSEPVQDWRERVHICDSSCAAIGVPLADDVFREFHLSGDESGVKFGYFARVLLVTFGIRCVCCRAEFVVNGLSIPLHRCVMVGVMLRPYYLIRLATVGDVSVEAFAESSMFGDEFVEFFLSWHFHLPFRSQTTGTPPT